MRAASVLALVAALFVVVSTAASIDVLAQDGSGSYLRVTPDRETYETYQKVAIRVESMIEVDTGNNTTALVPNEHILNFTMTGLVQGVWVVIDRQSFYLVNGSWTVYLAVDSEWTEAQVNVTVIDFETGLAGYAQFDTKVSNAYMIYLIERDNWQKLQVVLDELERLREDNANWRLALQSSIALIVILFASIIVLLFMKRDHDVSRDAATVSLWDRASMRVWKWRHPDPRLNIWLDPKRSWDPATAAAFNERRRVGPLRELRKHRDWLDQQIMHIEAGGAGGAAPAGLAKVTAGSRAWFELWRERKIGRLEAKVAETKDASVEDGDEGAER